MLLCLYTSGPALSILHSNNNGSTCLSPHTFNVRGLSSAMTRGQLSEDLGVDICLQEMKSHGEFDARSGHYRLLGLLSLSRHYAIATHSEERIVRYWSLCHRIAVTQLQLTSALVNDNTVSCLQNI